MEVPFTIWLIVGIGAFTFLCWVAFDLGRAICGWLWELIAPPQPALASSDARTIESDAAPLPHDWTEAQLEWVRALESDKYSQIAVNLHTIKGFDCLGVACDLYDDKRWLLFEHVGVFVFDVDRSGRGFEEFESKCELPREVKEHLDLRDPTGYIAWENAVGSWPEPLPRFSPRTVEPSNELEAWPEIRSLSDMNDSNFSFEQMAMFMRAFPKAVFR